MIQAIVVGDSLSPQKHRLTSLLCTFPKYLLAEAKTHRIVSQDSNQVEIQEFDVSFNADKNLSRNSASSRAIPFKRMVQMVKDNPFIPIAWQEDHKGMQGVKYLQGTDAMAAKHAWKIAKDTAILRAEELSYVGVTKQMANRLLEPFLWTTVLVSATEWDNFFELRCPDYCTNGKDHYRSKKDYIRAQPEELRGAFELMDDVSWLMNNKGQAEIHMMSLAEAIWDARNESTPQELEPGEWHIPFGSKINLEIPFMPNNEFAKEIMKIVKISTAMAARTSYTVVGDEKEIGYDRLIGIHDRMISQVPFHASPFEHCARAMSQFEWEENYKGIVTWSVGGSPNLSNKGSGWCRNFRGFIQYRHLIEQEELQI